MKKMISWNVNGLRACVGKGFLEYVKESDADIFCIQESKLQEGQIELDLPGYCQYWNYAEKKGYSGTAMFTKEEPVSVFLRPGDPGSTIRRACVITAEFDRLLCSHLLHAQLPGRFRSVWITGWSGRTRSFLI